jgi:hypothetical protein
VFFLYRCSAALTKATQVAWVTQQSLLLLLLLLLLLPHLH